MATVIVVSHVDDVDGILSGVVLLEHFGSTTKLHLASHRTQYACLLAISESAEVCGAQVIVVDLSLKPILFSSKDSEGVIEKIMAQAKSFTWLDHHQSAEIKRFEDLGGVYVDGSPSKQCGCSLCLDWLKPQPRDNPDYNRAWLKKCLRELAEASDYPNEVAHEQEIYELSGQLQKFITYCNCLNNSELLIDTIKQLADCDDCRPIIQREYQKCAPAFLEAEKEFDKYRMTVVIDNYDFMITLLNPLLPQKDSLRKLREKYEDEVSAYLGIFPVPVLNNLVFGTKREPSFPVEKFCFSLGGGGRENDGGFTLADGIDWNNFPVALEEIIKLLQTFIKTL